MRRLFALAVVVIHGLLLWVLIASMQRPSAHDAADPVYTRLWLSFDSPPPEPAPPVRKEQDLPDIARTDAVPEIFQETLAPETSPAIPDAAPADVAAPVPDVDWAREGKLAARRAALDSARPQQKGFSPDPKTIPKPCVSRKSSMEWKGEEDRKVQWVGILPVFRLGNCMVTIGAFACSLGKPQANGHLLDDMRSPDRSPSSVPDPNICD